MDHPVFGLSTASSFHVILFGVVPSDLIHGASLIFPLLAPPTPSHLLSMYHSSAASSPTASWYAGGKLIRLTDFATKEAKQQIDLLKQYHMQYLELDAGWYGEETDEDSDPRQVAPELKSELDIKQIVEYGKQKGIGIILYVNKIALKYTSELTNIYKSWGIAGIKFGFVDTEKPQHMRTTHEWLLSYGSVGIHVDIHDYYRPRGFIRTYPHLLTAEGIRGEERTPDCTHHTLIPFLRSLLGAADYTPRYFSHSIHCTPIHQLALPIIIFSPIQSLFWAEKSKQHLS